MIPRINRMTVKSSSSCGLLQRFGGAFFFRFPELRKFCRARRCLLIFSWMEAIFLRTFPFLGQSRQRFGIRGLKAPTGPNGDFSCVHNRTRLMSGDVWMRSQNIRAASAKENPVPSHGAGMLANDLNANRADDCPRQLPSLEIRSVVFHSPAGSRWISSDLRL